MGADLAVYVLYKGKQLNVYNAAGEEVTDELFTNEGLDVLVGDKKFYTMRGLPKNCPGDIKKSWEGYESLVTWYDYFELSALARTPEAYTINWEETDTQGKEIKYNEMTGFMRRVNILLDLTGYRYSARIPGDIVIVCGLSI